MGCRQISSERFRESPESAARLTSIPKYMNGWHGRIPKTTYEVITFEEQITGNHRGSSINYKAADLAASFAERRGSGHRDVH